MNTQKSLQEVIKAQKLWFNEFTTSKGEKRYYINSGLSRWDEEYEEAAALLAGCVYVTYKTGNIAGALVWNEKEEEWERISNNRARKEYVDLKIYILAETGEIVGTYIESVKDLILEAYQEFLEEAGE